MKHHTKKIISTLLFISMLCTHSIFSFADNISIDNSIDMSTKVIDLQDIENIEEIKEIDDIEDTDIVTIGKDDDFVEQDNFLSENLTNYNLDSEEIIKDNKYSEVSDADTLDTTSDELNIDIIEISTLSEATTDVNNNIDNFLDNDFEIATDSKASISVDDVVVSTISETDVFSESKDEVATTSTVHNRQNYGYIKTDYVAPRWELNENSTFGLRKLPVKYDTREEVNEHGLTIAPPVRSQSPYGTCWAFSTINMYEASIRKQGLVSSDKDSDLSEAALAYYTLLGLKDVTNDKTYNGKPGVEGDDYTILPDGNKDFGDVGGNQLEATLVASAYVGAVKEDSNTQYSQMKNITNNGLDKKYAFNSNAFEMLNVQYLNIEDRDLIKQAILDNGSVGIGYLEDRAYDNCHQHDGEWYYYFPVGSFWANHAVNIVGWDDNVPKEYFHCPDYFGDGVTEIHPEHNGAWLVRNSWSKYAPMHKDGYFWISYEDVCVESTAFTIEAAEAGRYKYNYHYDTTASLDTTKVYNGGRLGNVFKVEGGLNQVLEAVSVAIDGSNMDFNIEVYTNNNKMSNPTDGKKQTTQKVHKDISGIYTVELDNAIDLQYGTYYSIVLINKGKDFEVFDDYSSNSTSRAFHNEAKRGQSFSARFGSSYNWEDDNKNIPEGSTGSGLNYRIKGLANDGARITFLANNGTDAKAYQGVERNKTTKLRKVQFKNPGYVLKYWVDEDNNKYYESDNIKTILDVTLKAIWEPITYTVKFESYGGNVNPKTVKKTYNQPITLPTPTRQYSAFLNWYEDEEYTIKYDGSQELSLINNDTISIYAKYKGDKFQLNLMTNGGTISSGNLTEYEYGYETYLPTEVKPNEEDEEEGKEFYGWYDNVNFTGNRIYKVSKTDFGVKTFYARYEKRHNIVFDPNGGEGYMSPQSTFEIDNITLSPNRFVRYRYSFVNWIGSNGQIYNNGQTISNLTTDLILSANWSKNGASSGGGGGGGGGGGLSGLNGATAQVSDTTLQNNPQVISSNGTNTVWQQSSTGIWQMTYIDNQGQQQILKDAIVSIPTVVTINVNGVSTNVAMETKYYFDKDGNMYTGWLTTLDGSKYFFNTEQGAEIGKMIVGWKQVADKYYYFGLDGKMLLNTITPDGYQVGADGVWVK